MCAPDVFSMILFQPVDSADFEAWVLSQGGYFSHDDPDLSGTIPSPDGARLFFYGVRKPLKSQI